jgi:hypothetical protein
MTTLVSVSSGVGFLCKRLVEIGFRTVMWKSRRRRSISARTFICGWSRQNQTKRSKRARSNPSEVENAPQGDYAGSEHVRRVPMACGRGAANGSLVYHVAGVMDQNPTSGPRHPNPSFVRVARHSGSPANEIQSASLLRIVDASSQHGPGRIIMPTLATFQ